MILVANMVGEFDRPVGTGRDPKSKYALGKTLRGPWLHFSGEGFTDDRNWAWRGTAYQRENMRKLVPEPLVSLRIRYPSDRDYIIGWK